MTEISDQEIVSKTNDVKKDNEPLADNGALADNLIFSYCLDAVAWSATIATIAAGFVAARSDQEFHWSESLLLSSLFLLYFISVISGMLVLSYMIGSRLENSRHKTIGREYPAPYIFDGRRFVRKCARVQFLSFLLAFVITTAYALVHVW